MISDCRKSCVFRYVTDENAKLPYATVLAFPATPYNDIVYDMRLVLDTDVLLSGLRSTIGASRVLLLAVEARVVLPLVSVATVIEYEAVLKRAEHLQAAGLDAEEVDRFLDDFVANADHIAPHFRIRPSVRDPDDEMFAELAVNGQADALVSFNLGDYRPIDPRAPRLDISVCRPGDILRRLSWRPPATLRSASLPP
jgi:putative PIN family toxin of toxin-antitoxin system